MDTCFDKSKCGVDFKVYVYTQPSIVVTEIYRKMLAILRAQDYVTTDADRACLFVLSLDTLDRDKLSANFVKNINETIKSNLTYWNNGRNHVLFNLYSGSWPNYFESNLEMDVGDAILAKASFSLNNYRDGFDVSFPLFHADLPHNGSFIRPLVRRDQGPKKYLLSFKGKRYMNGVGTGARNSMYHLNNNRDILLLTTCKHGINWQELKDQRCDDDNALYDK